MSKIATQNQLAQFLQEILGMDSQIEIKEILKENEKRQKEYQFTFDDFVKQKKNSITIDYLNSRKFNLFEVIDLLSKNDNLLAIDKDGNEFFYCQELGLLEVYENGDEETPLLTKELLSSTFSITQEDKSNDIFSSDNDWKEVSAQKAIVSLMGAAEERIMKESNDGSREIYNLNTISQVNVKDLFDKRNKWFI